jgi:hypothetical protein
MTGCPNVSVQAVGMTCLPWGDGPVSLPCHAPQEPQALARAGNLTMARAPAIMACVFPVELETHKAEE